MKKRHKNKKRKKDDDVVVAKFIEVKDYQCNGNIEKMIRRFRKKVKREEVLKPYYDKLSHYKTKGQKEREKRLKGKWLHKKRTEKEKEIEKETV